MRQLFDGFIFEKSNKAHFIPVLMMLLFLMVFNSCSKDEGIIGTEDDNLRQELNLQTLGEIPYPADNQPNPEKIALGKLLFHDPILGGEKDVACATCHHTTLGFADDRDLPVGTSGTGLGADRVLGVSQITGDSISLTPRNAPTVFNVGFNAGENGDSPVNGIMFWDGRVTSLEEQAVKPPTSRVEMRGDAYTVAATWDSLTARLQAIPEYERLFREAFPEIAAQVDAGTRSSHIDSIQVGKAIAAYERELVTANSPYDRYVNGDDDAMSDDQIAGMKLFFNKAKCADCHNGAMFSDFSFVVQGVPQIGPGKDEMPGDDLGREEHTKNPADRYAFRTPTLRNVELTAPYMHDGVFATLEDVMNFYNDGAQPRHPAVTDQMLHPSLPTPLGLSDQEIQQVIAFMGALTDNGSAINPELLTVPPIVPSGLVPVFGVRANGATP